MRVASAQVASDVRHATQLTQYKITQYKITQHVQRKASMSNRNLIMTLAKVVIAAAWADGEITLEEENSLKDLLFRLPQIGLDQGLQLTGREWQLLDMYMHTPIDDAERARLLEELQVAMRTSRDKELAFAALDQLAAADGVVSDAERDLVVEMKQAIDAVDTSIIAQMGKLVGFAMQKRSSANAPNREQHLSDFIRNRVYYGVARRLDQETADLDLPEKTLRKLSLAGALMAKVAHVDQGTTEAEFVAIVQALQTHWQVSEEAAVFVTEVAVSEAARELDHHRTVRQFAEHTTPRERVDFLDVLFAVAVADGHAVYNEIEEIRAIARSLNLPNQDFIKAKIKIPRAQRDA